MKQIISSTQTFSALNATLYQPPFGVEGAFNGTGFQPIAATPWSVTGTLSNLKVTRDVSPGVGKTVTFTVFKNGSATAMTCTITHPATSASDVANTVSLSPGDTVSLRYTNTGGAPTFTGGGITMEFDSGDNFQQNYSKARLLNAPSTAPQYCAMCFGGDVVNFDTDTTRRINDELMPFAGAIKRIDVVHGGAAAPFDAMPASSSVVFVVMKNGIPQDGTSGTVNTMITLTQPATTASWTGTLSVVAGDRLQLRVTPSAGLVSGANQYSLNFSWRFDSTTAHRFMLGWSMLAGDTSTPYFAAVPSGTGVGTTETDSDAVGSVSTWYLISLHAWPAAGGTTAGFKAASRLNGTTPAGSRSVSFQVRLQFDTGPGTENFGIWVLGSAVSPGGTFQTITTSDTWSLQFTASAQTHAYVFSLDGNTNTLTETGKMKVFGNFDVTGYLEFQPMSAPAVPVTGARMYLDASDGDLKVKHANGNVDVISAN